MSLWRGGLWNSLQSVNGVGPWRGSLWRSEQDSTALAIKKLLFGDGQQGVMYVPQPTVDGQQVLYQDAAGTTPVTGDGQPVGYMADLSGNGNHATQATAASKPVYRTDGTLHWIEGDGVDDSLVIAGSKTALLFLVDGTGATLQFTFNKSWRDNNNDLLMGTTSLGASTENGIELLIDNRSTRVNRYRHVNPVDGAADSPSLDNAVNSSPVIVEYRQDAAGQEWSTSLGVSVTSGLATEPSHDFDMHIFRLNGSASGGILSFYGGIIVSERVNDLSNSRQYLNQLAGV